MDYVQALFSFFIAPLFGTVLLGMLWKRPLQPAGSGDCLRDHVSSIAMWAWVKVDPRRCDTWRCPPGTGHGREHVPGAVVAG